MRKVLLILVLALFTTASGLKAQNLGFTAGVSFSNVSFSGSDAPVFDSVNKVPLISPRVGFLYMHPVSDQFFFQTGVFASAKGYKIKNEDADFTAFYPVLYVDVPLQFGYTYDFGGAKLRAMTGPYLGLATYTQYAYKVSGEWENEERTIGDGSEPTDLYKPFDFGWNIEAGVEVNRFILTGYYSLGLIDVLAIDDDANLDVQGKNNVFGINLSILFGDYSDDPEGRGTIRL